MGELTYQRIKEAYDAIQLIRAMPGGMSWWSPSVVPYPVNDQAKGGRSYVIHNGSKIVYSQQQVVIEQSGQTSVSDYDKFLPVGVTRVQYRGPLKEYVTFLDVSGTRRYYYVPRNYGLRLVRNGNSYICANPLVDYRIEVDRAKAKTAREEANELLEYLAAIWDIQTVPVDYQRPWRPDDYMPAMNDDRDKWHEYLLSWKYAQRGSVSKDTCLKKIRDRYTSDSLAYKITVVPDTTTDHTSHWGMLGELRKAGLLKQYEDKNGQVKKAKRTTRTTVATAG
jgi:hypothetical protein